MHLGRVVWWKVGGDCVEEKLRDVLRDRLAVEGHGEGQVAVRVGHVVGADFGESGKNIMMCFLFVKRHVVVS